MEPRFQNLTLASGQVATSATEITTGHANKARPLSVNFSNVGGNEETLILTLSRNGATAVRVARVVLAADEAFLLRAFPINVTDSLRAQTTNASSVDYLVTYSQPGEAYALEVYDDSGRKKAAPYIIEQMDAVLS